jgi:acyl-CoA hydrolase
MDDMRPNIIKDILARTQLQLKPGMIPLQDTPDRWYQDIGGSMDWTYQGAREHDWKALQVGLEAVANMIVEKLNNCKTDTTYLRGLDMFDDDTLHRQRLFGMYVWAEVENANGYYRRPNDNR